MADYSDFEAQELVRETDRDIFFDALGIEDPRDVMPSDLIADQSRIDGWDQPLSDEEQIQTTAFGHEQPGFDRPLAYRQELDAQSENAQLRQQLAEKDQQILNMVSQTGEVRDALEAQQQARRDALLDIACDPERADQFLAEGAKMQQDIREHNVARVNASMAAAHARYGKDFERVYKAVTGLDRRSPLANELVNSIWNAQDPGEAMIALADNELLPALNANQGTPPPPFMPRSRYSANASASYNDHEGDFEDMDTYADNGADQEADIFRSAMRR